MRSCCPTPPVHRRSSPAARARPLFCPAAPLFFRRGRELGLRVNPGSLLASDVYECCAPLAIASRHGLAAARPAAVVAPLPPPSPAGWTKPPRPLCGERTPFHPAHLSILHSTLTPYLHRRCGPSDAIHSTFKRMHAEFEGKKLKFHMVLYCCLVSLKKVECIHDTERLLGRPGPELESGTASVCSMNGLGNRLEHYRIPIVSGFQDWARASYQ